MARKPMPNPSDINLNRFWDKVVPMKDCLIWTGKIDQSGYGVFAVKGSLFSAHRISHTVYIEEVPPHLDVLQTCGNRACVKPAHLEMMPDKEKRGKEEAIRRGIEGPVTTYLDKLGNEVPAPGYRSSPPMLHGPCTHCGCFGTKP